MPLGITTKQIKRSAVQAIHHPPKPSDRVTVSKEFQKEKAKMVKELIPFLTYLYKKHMKAQIQEGTDLEMLKLINKAMKLMPGSPKQKKVIQQLNKLRTKAGLDPLKEDIKIPIKVGDTVLGGKFKNKRIVVKSIGKNDKGDITINGKPLLKFRLLDEAAKRDYKKEYEKYGKSEKAKKYRAQLNKYNRDKGTYGNGDGKDASHKGGKIVGFEDESKNRGRREKSRLKKETSINEIPMGDLQKIDTFADKKLNPVDVVITDKHFFDRLNDPRNGKEISSAELIGFFKRLSKKKKEFVDFLNKYNSVVAVDDRTNINIPFMKRANKAIAKTVMRKKDFKTPDQKLDI